MARIPRPSLPGGSQYAYVHYYTDITTQGVLLPLVCIKAYQVQSSWYKSDFEVQRLGMERAAGCCYSLIGASTEGLKMFVLLHSV